VIALGWIENELLDYGHYAKHELLDEKKVTAKKKKRKKLEKKISTEDERSGQIHENRLRVSAIH